LHERSEIVEPMRPEQVKPTSLGDSKVAGRSAAFKTAQKTATRLPGSIRRDLRGREINKLRNPLLLCLIFWVAALVQQIHCLRHEIIILQ
jgi:hypothetical protein